MVDGQLYNVDKMGQKISTEQGQIMFVDSVPDQASTGLALRIYIGLLL
jgi:hypothetical protein